MKWLAALLMAACLPAAADPLKDERYCGAPARTSTGAIARRQDVRAAFQHIHPCPSTGKRTGACPGWAKDHVVPLACGGCDAVSNLQWLPDRAKSASGPLAKDRYERTIYCKN